MQAETIDAVRLLTEQLRACMANGSVTAGVWVVPERYAEELFRMQQDILQKLARLET